MHIFKLRVNYKILVLLSLFILATFPSFATELTFTHVKKECIDSKHFCNFKYGKPFDQYGKVEQIICRQNYSLGYDYDNRIPLWVIYEVTKENLDNYQSMSNKIKLNGSTIRKKYNTYFADTCIPSSYRVISNNYTKTKCGQGNCARGHLAPFASIVSNEYTALLSNILTNITPQNSSFNNGIWKALENYERDLVNNGKVDSLYTIVGSIYDEEDKKYIDNGKILIPNSFFKILYDQEKNKALSFIISNKKDMNTSARDIRLSNYLRNIDEIESLTGFNFFRELSNSREDFLENSINNQIWKD